VNSLTIAAVLVLRTTALATNHRLMSESNRFFADDSDEEEFGGSSGPSSSPVDFDRMKGVGASGGPGPKASTSRVSFSQLGVEEEAEGEDLDLDEPDFDEEVGGVRGGSSGSCARWLKPKHLFLLLCALLLILSIASWRWRWFQDGSSEIGMESDDDNVLREEGALATNFDDDQPRVAPTHLSPKRTTKGPRQHRPHHDDDRAGPGE
jgi:hypothetical protein